MDQTQILTICEVELGDMTLDQGHDTPSSYKQNSGSILRNTWVACET